MIKAILIGAIVLWIVAVFMIAGMLTAQPAACNIEVLASGEQC